MCTPNTELQFCTCVEGDIYEVKDIYIWTLSMYIDSKKSMIRGKIMKSTEDFENGISAENIISKLNEENIFDFEYTPKERDTLHISFNAENREEYKYFSLIFRDGIWRKGRNPVFVSVEKSIAKGELKVLYKEENKFIKYCDDLKLKFGIDIPESIKVRCANLKNDSEDPTYLAIKNFKEYKIFYKLEFIKHIVNTHFKTFPKPENSDRLQILVNEAQNRFSLLENKFISEKTNVSFLNRCFKDFDNNIEECFFVAIPIKEEYLIINGSFSGKIVFKSKKDKRYFKDNSQKLKFEDFEKL
ncbi:hypothetical protein A0O34_02740 [Chryseobacterium glaciei]|uniref:Uncharacterized protein n=1 Tax=Chryseobacterium glaciei TaxID=1685010 RepID=A0A172XRJ3_9FLAO|nr:hypothetical protein [Chryseobacterium glaciei]ANF49534.1 hypothetical protein A0O34_02740 [Chryseobacterium glaciei]